VTWTARVDLPSDPVTGNRRQARKTLKTKREAQDWLTQTVHELQTGGYIEPTKAMLAE
jgi:hypothetical protein